MTLGEPGHPRAVAHALAQQRPHGRAVAVHDGSVLSALERPARLAQAEAEVGVAARADALAEPARIVKRGAEHSAIGCLGEGPALVGEGLLLAHRLAQVLVALGEREPCGRGRLVAHASGQDGRAVARRRLEVGLDEAWERFDVGVEENDQFEPRSAPRLRAW